MRPLLPFLLSPLLLLPALAQDAAPTAPPLPTAATDPTADVPAGKGERVVQAGPVLLTVYTFRPEAWSGERLLIVMHGTLRNADEYRDDAINMGR
ncbi:MAG: hypothetical protein K8J09_05195 [Planctomycetes bacterium]|nr:hypothetical protein [Planctomycetota bacterium]